MAKQLTGKKDDTPLHLAARMGNLELVCEILTNSGNEELKDLLSKENQSGETALYVAAEYGYVDLVKELIKYCDSCSACIKARNGLDAFHIASKEGYLEVLKVLAEANPDLVMTTDPLNTTALHTAAAKGHIEVVNFLLEKGNGLVAIARSNCKTALHSAARNGHVEVVKALLSVGPGSITTRTDKKGQTALHMAVKGTKVEVVDELIESDPSLVNVTDKKGNTALHIATRKKRVEIVKKLLACEGILTQVINKSGETALDTAENSEHSEITAILRGHGVQSATKIVKPPPPPTRKSRELKQTVSDIKHELHYQLKHTRQTRKSVQNMVKRLNKMHEEGLNNAFNSTTVVAVLIATVTFAAIFTLPGQYPKDDQPPPPESSLGEANIAADSPKALFVMFFISDSIALFISLAVVVIQTSIVATEKKAKKQMMTVINKLMWLACVMVSGAFIALSYIIVGKHEKLLAVGVTCIGTVIMATTLGTMCYWIVLHRLETSKSRSIRRSSLSSSRRSRSQSTSLISDSDFLNECNKFYAI